MTFTTAHFHVTTAQFVINCTLKYALIVFLRGLHWNSVRLKVMQYHKTLQR